MVNAASPSSSSGKWRFPPSSLQQLLSLRIVPPFTMNGGLYSIMVVAASVKWPKTIFYNGMMYLFYYQKPMSLETPWSFKWTALGEKKVNVHYQSSVFHCLPSDMSSHRKMCDLNIIVVTEDAFGNSYEQLKCSTNFFWWRWNGWLPCAINDWKSQCNCGFIQADWRVHAVREEWPDACIACVRVTYTRA
jgi:hypothetical protein